MRVPDWASGAILFAVATAALIMALGFPAAPMGQRVGPSLFPVVISSGLMITAVVLILGSLSRRAVGLKRGRPDAAPKPTDLRTWGVLAVIVGLPVFYMLTVETLGFLLTGFILLCTMMGVLWSGPVRIALISAAAVLAIDFLFRGLFGIPLDPGLFRNPWW